MKKAAKRQGAKPPRWATIDDYLAALPELQRVALQKLRNAISRAAPCAEEGFSYGLPAFRLNRRPLMCFGAATHHCSLFPMSPGVIRALANDLKRYDTAKGTIRFVTPLPSALVRKLVKARIAELATR